MPELKPEHISPTDEEEADIQRQIAEDPEDSAHISPRLRRLLGKQRPLSNNRLQRTRTTSSWTTIGSDGLVPQ